MEKMRKGAAALRRIPGWVYGVLALLFYRVLYFQTISWPYLVPDSNAYLTISKTVFTAGSGTTFRPPAYPIILKITGLLGEEAGFRAVVFLQVAVSLLSCVFLYRLIVKLFNFTRGGVFAMMAYGISQPVVGFEGTILTESFALSGTVIFLWLLVNFLESNRLRTAVAILFLLLVLIFLRPTFAVFYGAFGAFLLLRLLLDRKTRKTSAAGALAALLGVVPLLLYASAFKADYGVFSLSTTHTNQLGFVAVEKGYYKTYHDAELVRAIDEGLAADPDGVRGRKYQIVEDQLGLAGLSQFAKECIRNVGSLRLADMLGMAITSGREYYRGYESLIIPYNSKPFGAQVERGFNLRALFRAPAELFQWVTLGRAWIAALLEGVAAVYLWIKTKKIPWIHGWLCLMPLAVLIGTILMTNGEFPRTSICTIPFVHISALFFIRRLAGMMREKPGERAGTGRLAAER